MSTKNYQDQDKNADGYQGGVYALHSYQQQAQQRQTQYFRPRSGIVPKEAVIPSNLNGAKTNEWIERNRERYEEILSARGSSSSSRQQTKPKTQVDSKSNKILNTNQEQQEQIRRSEEDSTSQLRSLEQLQSYYKPFEYPKFKQKSPQLQKQSPSQPSLFQNIYSSEDSKPFKQDHGDSKNPVLPFSKKLSINFLGKSSETKEEKTIGEPSKGKGKSENALAKEQVHRALIKESKDDYKRIFSEVVKEYSNDENYYYEGTKNSRTTYLLCVIGVVLCAMIFFDAKAAMTPRFCTKGINDKPNCSKCPKHAECHHFVMRCVDGYIQMSDYKCKLNPNLSISAENLLIEKIAMMREEIGNQICFQVEEVEFVKTPRQEERLIAVDVLLSDLELRVKNKHASLSQEQILMKFIQSKENQEKYGFQYNSEQQIILTSLAKFSIFCSVKLFVNRNPGSCKSIGVIAFAVCIFLRSYLKKQRQKQVVELIYNELIQEIQKSNEKMINIQYHKENIVGKYKDEFNELIWTLVDQHRFDRKKIHVYRDFDGLYWISV